MSKNLLMPITQANIKPSRSVSFGNEGRDFAATLNKRVNDHFKTTGSTRHANLEMVVKTICMFLLYFGPYGLIISGLIHIWPMVIAMVIVMSIGLAGIGLCVMHDANHGAYSNRKWINTMLGYSINLIGANAFNWKMQHNVLHHSFTNIHDEDEDISPRGIIRLTPHSPLKGIHRYQFIYAWPLYGLMTLVWLFFKDFVRIIRYQKNGMAKKNKYNVGTEWAILLASKVLYLSYIFVIPLLVTDLTWWQIFIGIVIMHYIAGFLLAIIFQPAHVIEGTTYPLPDETNYSVESSWALHQLQTTTNFGNEDRWFSWFAGGLNFQIEHHLFPNICHVHYRKIASIVKYTAEEFGLPYKSTPTFRDALIGHGRMLKQLGRPEMITQVNLKTA
ncbi:MAG: acyl-CoA desaturase [Chryseolinea sp.]